MSEIWECVLWIIGYFLMGSSIITCYIAFSQDSGDDVKQLWRIVARIVGGTLIGGILLSGGLFFIRVWKHINQPTVDRSGIYLELDETAGNITISDHNLHWETIKPTVTIEGHHVGSKYNTKEDK